MIHFVNSYFEKLKVVEKKNTKVHATRPKGGLGIHTGLEKCTTLYFEREEFVFRLRRPFSVALLLLSHVCKF